MAPTRAKWPYGSSSCVLLHEMGWSFGLLIVLPNPQAHSSNGPGPPKPLGPLAHEYGNFSVVRHWLVVLAPNDSYKRPTKKISMFISGPSEFNIFLDSPTESIPNTLFRSMLEIVEFGVDAFK
jgi:hypothetical protein